MQKPRQRRDAAHNRLKVLQAASEMMRESGADIPFEAIAQRAGVTRPTIYRNFVNRFDLYAAVIDHEVALIKQEMETEGSTTLALAMQRLVELMAVYDKFGAALPYLNGFTEIDCNAENLCDLVAAPLRQAQRHGQLRADLAPDDIVLACRMIASGWRLDMAPDRAVALKKRYELIMKGLAAANG